MVAAGFKVYFLDGYRSTPEFSFCVRYKQCACGIMVTASHNPPSDNAVKVYWSTGGQCCRRTTWAIIDRVMNTQEIHVTPFAEAVAAGKIVICQDEVDAAFVARDAIATPSWSARSSSHLLAAARRRRFGRAAVLKADGFQPTWKSSARMPSRTATFPNVPGHVSNPENPERLRRDHRARQGSGRRFDPRHRSRLRPHGLRRPANVQTRRRLGYVHRQPDRRLLADYILEQRKRRAGSRRQHYVVKTLVTTEMIRRIADSYGVRTYGDLHVASNGSREDDRRRDRSGSCSAPRNRTGYLVGQYARDKDAAVAAC